MKEKMIKTHGLSAKYKSKNEAYSKAESNEMAFSGKGKWYLCVWHVFSNLKRMRIKLYSLMTWKFE